MIPDYYEFQNFGKVCSGRFALEHIPYELKMQNASRPLLLTDQNLEKIGLLKLLQKAMNGVDTSHVFSDIRPDTSIDTVRQAAACYQSSGCDSLVALGGGSVLDTAKGVAMVISQGGKDIYDLLGCEELTKGHSVPFLAVPTTSGTGSEATTVAVIAHPQKDVKLEFISGHIQPQVSILDPRMTQGLPPSITASTAMDALCHAIEAFSCLQKNPVSDGYAIAAIRLITANLSTAINHPKDPEARLAMANASMLAGAAFGNSMVGGVHAIGHSLGGICRIAHAEAMAILLPHVMEFNLSACQDTYSELLLHLASPGVYASVPAHRRAARAVAAIRSLNKKLHESCHLPITLEETGKIRPAQFEAVAKKALRDGAILFNPRAMKQNDIIEILKKAF